jgi:hypothetical protein
MGTFNDTVVEAQLNHSETNLFWELGKTMSWLSQIFSFPSVPTPSWQGQPASVGLIFEKQCNGLFVRFFMRSEASYRSRINRLVRVGDAK